MNFNLNIPKKAIGLNDFEFEIQKVGGRSPTHLFEGKIGADLRIFV